MNKFKKRFTNNTLNSVAKRYRVKPFWLFLYIKEYCSVNNIEFEYNRPLKKKEIFIIESALGSIELIDGLIDPLVYNNNTALAKLYGVNRITFASKISSTPKLREGLKVILPNRNKYVPGEVGLIIMEFGMPDGLEE